MPSRQCETAPTASKSVDFTYVRDSAIQQSTPTHPACVLKNASLLVVLTTLELQSRCGDKPPGNRLVFRFPHSAVLKGLNCVLYRCNGITSWHSTLFAHNRLKKTRTTKEKVAHGYHTLTWQNCGKMAKTSCHGSLVWTCAIPRKGARKNKTKQTPNGSGPKKRLDDESAFVGMTQAVA